MDHPSNEARLERLLTAIDAENAPAPSAILRAGADVPLALAEGRAAHAWVLRLRADPGAPPPDALLAAARGHHIRRWETPREGFPEGREGYLAWRTHLYGVHAGHLERLMRAAGYGDDEVALLRRIVGKRGIKAHPDVQTYEDAVALAFLEIQFPAFAARTERETMVRALARTWLKMSEAGRAAAGTLHLPPELAALVAEAVGG